MARNISAWDTAVISVTRVLAGDAYNVIPETATLGGTVRAMRRETLTKVEAAMRRIAGSTAAAFGATATLDFRLIFAPLVNHAGHTEAIADAAAELVGEAHIDRAKPPAHGAPRISPSCWNGCPAPTSTSATARTAPRCTTRTTTSTTRRSPTASALFARLVERSLPRG